MNLYEILFILNPALDEAEMTKVVDKIEDFIKSSGGEILKVDDWGKRKLAYEVKNQKKGHYILLNFRMKPALIAELEKSLKLTETVIKFLIIKLETFAMNREKAEDEKGVSLATESEGFGTAVP